MAFVWEAESRLHTLHRCKKIHHRRLDTSSSWNLLGLIVWSITSVNFPADATTIVGFRKSCSLYFGPSHGQGKIGSSSEKPFVVVGSRIWPLNDATKACDLNNRTYNVCEYIRYIGKFVFQINNDSIRDESEQWKIHEHNISHHTDSTAVERTQTWTAL